MPTPPCVAGSDGGRGCGGELWSAAKKKLDWRRGMLFNLQGKSGPTSHQVERFFFFHILYNSRTAAGACCVYCCIFLPPILRSSLLSCVPPVSRDHAFGLLCSAASGCEVAWDGEGAAFNLKTEESKNPRTAVPFRPVFRIVCMQKTLLFLGPLFRWPSLCNSRDVG